MLWGGLLRRERLKSNIDIVIRKLTALKDNLDIMDISKGQETFINTYLGLADEYVNNSIELLDRKKYHETVEELMDD